MQLKKTITFSLLSFLSMNMMAQDVSHNQVHQVQQNIQNTIRGTMDGVTKAPQNFFNSSNFLVFPRVLDQNINMNPWSKTKQKHRPRHQNSYGGLPKGNPWAPVGDTQNIPYDQSAMIEKNPYTDAPVPARRNNYSSSFTTTPFGFNQGMATVFNDGFNNRSNNGSFPSPFGNQFWPGGNNGNSSMPFMPW